MERRTLRGIPCALAAIVFALVTAAPIDAQCPMPSWDCSEGCDLVQRWYDCLEWYPCGAPHGYYYPACMEYAFDILWDIPPLGCSYWCGTLLDWRCDCLVLYVE